MRIIAVEDGLDKFKEGLEKAGYKTVDLSQNFVNPIAIVVSGMDDNLMGMETITNEIPVINCEGMSVEQVVREIKNRMVH
ncbi:YkuS family protein [Alkalicella caledoniensis]|uniref:YkuS family protein n=1 Tax=Alkalicella caledoniensis TaxID=2731377 RepID=A0A7G9W8K5_ALKCA|nr:YkuS family protein [Alkalicella caledoniensis]QNO15017.1 YkuS family protein [Alkalicella caledoniensis]